MKIRGEIIILCLIICLIFSLSAVSAADDLNNTDVTSNNDLLSLPTNNNDSVIGAGWESFTKLNETINSAQGDTIDLCDNYVFTPGEDDAFVNGIRIDREITIVGHDLTIDGANKARIFDIYAPVTIKNLVFVNGNSSSSGGAIDIEDAIASTMDSCTFINNTARENGGAIYWDDGSHDCVVTSCQFINNTAGINGGAIDWHMASQRGAIQDSVFTNNTAKRSGGAVHWSGHYGDIIGSTFTNNVATGEVVSEIGGITGGGDGGAVLWVGSHGIIKDCNFNNNYAKIRGGAIFIHGNSTENSTNTTVDNCRFENNIAHVNGGGVDWQYGAHNGTLTNSVFINNTAWRSGGGAYWNGYNGTMINCSFTDNHATYQWNHTLPEGIVIVTDTPGGNGGAMVWRGSMGTIENCNFTDNTAYYLGGAIHLRNNDEVNFTNCNFTENNAGTNGGAIYFNTGATRCTIDSCTFDNNVANRSAGAIFWIGTNGHILNSNFTNNHALGGVSGAVVHNGTNTTGGSGGAIIWAGSNGNVNDCIFISNTAAKRGGAIFLESTKESRCSDVTIKDSSFESNIADINGGAVAWDEGAENGLMENIAFINNTAKRNGGAIFWNGYNGTIKNSKFDNNRATGTNWEYTLNINMGDKIIVGENGTLTLGNIVVLQQNHIPVSFDPSVSQYEGKLVVLNYTSPTDSKILRFESYVLTGNASAGYKWKPLDEINITVSESIISPVDWAIDQYFGGDGGTVLWSGNLGLVENCTFIDSNSARRGGGAYMTGSDYVTYKDCYFENCTSGTNGGGVDWLAGANYGKIINCTFNNTRAARSAGAIYYDGWYGEMTNITIINTQSWGGALKTSKDGKVNYAGWDSSHWDTNTTGGDAGAIMYTGSFITVYNVTFTNCNGSGRGGAVFLQDNHNVTFDKCTFENNIAAGTAKNTYVNDKDISSGFNMWLTGYGGAIAFDVGATNGTIKNSKFINNTAIRIGGAISFGKGSSNAKVYNSTFDNNTAYRNGGAISWDGTDGNMDKCNFSNNSALGIDINTDIFNPTSLDDFKHNGTDVPTYTPAGNKKEMYIRYQGYNPETKRSANYTMYVYNGTQWNDIEFTTETGPSTVDWAMDEYYGGDGGTIYWRGDNGEVCHCIFIDSNSARRGGGAYMTGSDNITFQNSYFENCTSGTNGGGLDWLAGANNGKVINCTFNSTHAARSAGAIYYDGDYGEMINITIINATNNGGALKVSKDGRVKYAGWDSSHWDTNTTGGDAGAIMFTGNYEYIYNATFINCTSVGRGGAVFLQDNHNVTFELCVFENNYAKGIANNTWANYTQERNEANNDTKVNYKLTGHGGAVAFDVNAKNCKIIDSNFTQNLARRNGGALNFDDGSTNNTVENCRFDNNTVYDDGGAINLGKGSDFCSIINTIFYNNTGQGRFTSTTKGGTICLEGSNITIDRSEFILGAAYGNETEGAKIYQTDGGALFVTGNYVNITNTKFDSCFTPNYAGAIKIIGNYTKVDNCTFENCTAPKRAGAIYVEGNSVLINNSRFNASISEVAGAIYIAGNDSNLVNSNITNCSSSVSAGSVHISGNNADINGTSFINCTTQGTHGGAICISGNYTTVIDSTFENCRALYFNKTEDKGAIAGAIHISGANATIIKSTFNNIYASDDGGALYVEGADCKVYNSTFEKTIAGDDGGAILWSGERGLVYNSTFTIAQGIGLAGAHSKGGAINIVGNYSVVTKSKFIMVSAVTDGGAIYATGNHVNITDSSFNKCNVSHTVEPRHNHGGGSIYVEGDYGYIANCTFEQNNAKLGGAMFIEGDNVVIDNITTIRTYVPSSGGAIFVQGDNATIKKSDISMTNASVDGGAIYIHGANTNISATSISMCFAYGDGGAIYVNGTDANIEHSTIFRNNATYGGSIYINGTDAVIFDSTMMQTAARADGGSIYVFGEHAVINQTSCSMTSAVNGGSMYIAGDNAVIVGSSFTKSNATEDGGALYVTGDDCKVYNSTFELNTAYDDGGSILWVGENGLIYNSTFTNVRAIGRGHHSEGGAINLVGDNTVVTKSNFTMTSAATDGGAIFATGNHINVTESNFNKNNVSHTNETGYNHGGGSIYVEGDYGYIANCTFEQNNAKLGGAMFIEGDNAVIDNITTIHTFVPSSGGAIFVQGDNAIIKKSSISMSNASVDGGAIYIDGVNTNISSTSISMCVAKDEGGAIFVDGANTNIEYCTISKSNATNYGGGVYIKGNDEVIFNSTLMQCHADKDGGIVYISGLRAVINQSSLMMSSSTQNGGAVYIAGNNAVIEESSFNKNDATESGGAVYIEAEYANISGSHFNLNNATQNGGALYIKGSHATITNSSFNQGHSLNKIGDTSSEIVGGGAIYSKGSFSNIYYCNFTNCSSKDQGGAIFWYADNLQYCNVVGCRFINNTAYPNSKTNTRGGGAIYWKEGSKYCTIQDSVFIKNSVQSSNKADGGAVLWDFTSNGLINNCTFDANYVTTSHTGDVWVQGGGLFLRLRGTNFTISNSRFENCWSIKEAGGAYLSPRNGEVGPIDLLVVNTTFINNTANATGPNCLGGGAIQIKESHYTTLRNVTFENNTANIGGAISCPNGPDSGVKSDYIIGCTFIGNKANITATREGLGGSIYINLLGKKNPTIRIYNSTFSDGYAKYDGGAIYAQYIEGSGNLTFINNTANRGGALYWFAGIESSSKAPDIEGMTFINNNATYGGAIYIPKEGTKVLHNNFTGNNATYGGAIYVPVSTVTISYNNFTKNNATEGGAIYILNTTKNVFVSQSTFDENHAKYGGAIWTAAEITGTNPADHISYCNFTKNTAVNGSAIYVAGSKQNIGFCNFDGNNASENGGAIYYQKDLTSIEVHDSTFKSSYAKNGGAIYNAGTSQSKNLLIKNSTFIKNIAIYNGGAVLYIANDGLMTYRDYFNGTFDNLAVPSGTDTRIDLFSNDTSHIQIISNSLFEDNEDYLFYIESISDRENPFIAVYLDRPKDWVISKLRYVVSLTNVTTHEVIQTVVVNSTNYESHTRGGRLYVSFSDLKANTTYNITVSFSDEYHMEKTNSTLVTAHGEKIGQFRLLQNLINDAVNRGESEIVLNRTFTFTPVDDHGKTDNMDDRCINLTNINYPFTIRGDNWRIDAAGYSRIFYITSPNVTIENVVLVGGNASGEFGDGIDMGGAIYWAGANGTLIGSIIDRNNASIGGGIYYNVTAPDCKIINTTFIYNNAVTNGGAIDCNASRMELINTTFQENHAHTGAALCREINATEGHGNNNTFIGNYADYAGAALAWINATRISINNYHFSHNYVGYSGGAIYVGEGSKNCEILNCDFEGNYVDNSTGGHGGAIEWYSEAGIVVNSSFIKNHAYDGGAIYVGSGSGEINITNSTFGDNYATTTGGAISIEASAVTVNASNFYNNKAQKGGALYVGGVGTSNYIYSSVFEGNIATGTGHMDGLGGAIDWVASSGTIIDTEFTSNCADYGGGVYFGGRSEESIITSCIFTDNHAKYNGGAIDCNSSKMYLTHTIFDGNYAQFGSALCRETNAKSGSGENNTFINNHAYVSGAALGWMGSIGIKITNYTFINNSADVSGGAIYVGPNSHNCSVIDCTFEDNYITNKTDGWDNEMSWQAWDDTTMHFITSRTDDESLINTIDIFERDTISYYKTVEDLDNLLSVGGAINIQAANATINDTDFTRNIANLGGAIYVGANSGATTLNRTVFRENIAYTRGGAVNLHASAVHIDDGEFYNNIAINGSALYVGGVGTENKVHGSIFEGNNATGYGGGIYWVAHEGEIFNSQFTNNWAEYGGGIYLNGRSANTNITNTTFKSNTALKNGGAIDCNASNIGIYNLTFDSNIAGEYGAALCREVGATSGHGTNNTFKSNYAGISGAALAWLNVKNIHIIDYTFIDNSAGTSGGAIYASQGSDNCIIENCAFDGNYLTNLTDYHFGGAIDCVADNMTINMSKFNNNRAYNGGAVYVGSGSKFVRVLNSNFTENRATGSGGALGLKANDLTINNVTFKSNKAEIHGGALYAGGTGKNNTITYAVFEDNTAGDHGGAIVWLASAGEITYSNFTGNKAVYGGGIYLNGVSSNSKIANVIFDSNEATKNGGAIDCNATMMGLNNTIFKYNVAKEYGAALCREANATGGYGGNNTFIGNSAGISGAALAWLGVENIRINNYHFYNNTAEVSGGAIYANHLSSNCQILNSEFVNSSVIRGEGGDICLEGANGTIINSTFANSISKNGGSIHICEHGVNTTIINATFTLCTSLEDGGVIGVHSDNLTIINATFFAGFAKGRGGAIAGIGANNALITNATFKYSGTGGHSDASGNSLNYGGSIYWEHGYNVTVSNAFFFENKADKDGASIAMRYCDNITLYNLTHYGNLADNYGGAMSIFNSTNVLIELNNISYMASGFGGGALYLYNVTANIKDSSLYHTYLITATAFGGAIYANGEVNITNTSFIDFDATSKVGAAIYFEKGNFTLSGDYFNGANALWINKGANVTILTNNITGERPTKDINYLNKPYDVVENPVNYAVWNNGDLSLDNNTFDYVIFNNGTIWTNTTTWVLDNTTWNETWGTFFTFFGNITDDNNNTIISVHTFDTWNDVFPDAPHYPMPYNALVDTLMYYQGNFTIFGQDIGLMKNTVKNARVNVKMPTNITVTHGAEYLEDIEFSVKISTPVQSNYTFDTSKLVIKINDQVIPNDQITFYGNGTKWSVVYANFTQHHMRVGTYTITAEYLGDVFHEASKNATDLVLFSRPIWIKVHAQDIFYGQTLIVNISSNATNTENGRVNITIDGKTVSLPVHLEANGTAIYKIPNEYYATLIEPGEHIIGVIFYNGTYYAVQSNSSTFNVYKLDTPLVVNATNITYGESERINVTVNKTATGYIAVRIGNDVYVAVIDSNGTAKFNISGLAAGNYTATVTFPGDNHFNNISKTVTFKVNATTAYTFDVKVDNVEYGKNATVRVLVPTNAKGNVSIYVDGVFKGNVTVVNGTAQLDVGILPGGEHVVNATYNGDSTYARKDKNNTRFNVTANTSWDMTIKGDYKPYGEDSVITITTKPYNLQVRNVNITIDNVSHIVPLDVNGTATLTLNNISAGSHNATVSYIGDPNYSNKTKKFFPSIPKATPTLTLTQNGTDLTVSVTSEAGNVTGNVTFRVNNVLHTVVLDEFGNATLFNNLTPGNNYVIVTYNGNANYTTAEIADVYHVDRFNTQIIVNATNITYGENEIINVTVNEGATGFIAITIAGQIYVSVINNGVARFSIPGLAADNYTDVVATYYPDNTDFERNSTTFTFRVNRTSDYKFDINVESMEYKQNATVWVELETSATGNASIYIDNEFRGNVTIVNGEGVLRNIAGLVGGDHTLKVAYHGDSTYAPRNETKTFKVNPNSSWRVSITDVDYRPYGETSTINVTNIPSDIIGTTIVIQIDGVNYTRPIVDGKATLRLNNLSAGSHVGYVIYSGDANYGPINQTFRPSISKAEPTITLIQNGTDVIATVSGNATGTVTFTVNNIRYTINLEGRNATLRNNLTIGNNYVSAKYNGDQNYSSVETNDLFIIGKNNITISVDNIVTPIYVEGPVTITAELNESVTGEVVFNINGMNYTVPINNANTTSYTYTPVNNATLTVIATFKGNANYYSNSSEERQFTVNRNPTTTQVALAKGTILVGEDAVVTITMDPSINTTVTLKVGDRTYNVAVVNGKGYYNVSGLANDTYDVNVTFAGNYKYVESNDTVKLYVNKITDYNIVIDAETVMAGEWQIIRVIFPNDAVVDNANLVFKVNGTQYQPDIDNGIAYYNYTAVNNGSYVVNVTYSGDNKYFAKNNTKEFIATPSTLYNIALSKVVRPYGEDTVITVQIPKDATKNVTISVDGIDYSRKANADGYATLILNNLSAGSHVVNATYPGGDLYPEKSKIDTFTVEKAKSNISVEFITPIYVGDNATITVTMGQEINGTVILSDGKNNYSVTVTNGAGRYNITGLANDTYSIKATFEGNENYTGNVSEIKDLKVNRIATDINVTVETSVTYGNKAVFTVELNATINTTAIVTVDGKNYTVVLTNGVGKLNVSELNVNNYKVNVTYKGDGKYIASNNTTAFNVVPANLGAKVVALNVTVQDKTQFIINVTDDFKGKVKITVEGDELYDGTPASLLSLDKLTAGAKIAIVEFYGDSNYVQSPLSVNFNVSRVTPTINVTIRDVTYPANATATINITNKANGTVNITVGTKVFNGTVLNGIASVNLTDLAAGLKDAVVEFFTSDDYNNNATSSANFVVNQNGSNVDIGYEQVYKVGDSISLTFKTENSTGDLTIYLNGKYNNASEHNPGTFVLNLEELAEGTYIVNAYLDGDENYTESNRTVTFIVVKNDITISVNDTTDPATIVAGTPVTFTANLNETVTGDVIFTIGGANYTAHVDNANNVSYTYTPVNNATITVVATFVGNSMYNSKVSDEKEFAVNKIASDINVAVKNIIYGEVAVITVTMNPSINASVVVNVGGKNYTVALTNGVGKLNVSGLNAAKNYKVNVNYTGDSRYSACNNTTTFNVNKAALSPSVIALNVTVEEYPQFVIDVPDDFTGRVVISVDSGAYLYNGQVTGNLLTSERILPAGEYFANVIFRDDANYNESKLENIKFTVSRVTPEINVTIDDVTYPGKAVAVIKITNKATGDVNVTVDGKVFPGQVTDGIGRVDLKDLSAGNKNASVEFIATDKYNNNVNATSRFIIYPNNSLINIKDNAGVYKVGQDVDIKFIAVNSTGDITIYINGEYNTTLRHGIDDGVSWSNLTEGAYTITAVLAGDQNYTGYTTTTSFKVVRNNVTISVNETTLPSTIVAGSPVTFTANLNASVTGDVIFTINGANYTVHVSDAKVATYEYTPVNNATITVVATYAGDNKYNNNVSTPKHFNVNRISTSVELIVDSPIIAGDDATIRVNMDPDINGTVVLNVSGKYYNVAVVNGVGTYTVSNLANATYNVTAVFAGDDKYAGSTSDTVPLLVNKVRTKLSISIDKTSISVGDKAVISIILNQSINAVVTVKVNGQNNTVGLVNGKGNFTLSDLANGTYKINAVFAGDDKYVQSISDPVTLEVNKISTGIAVSVSPITYGEIAEITVVLNKNINDSVVVNVDGKNYTVALVNGQGKLNVSGLNAGSYDVNVTYAGDSTYSASKNDTVAFTVDSADLTPEVTALNVTVLDNTKFIINVTDDFKGNVSIKVGNDVLYNGTVKTIIDTAKLTAGTYTANVTFYGDSNYNNKPLTVSFTVSTTNTTVKVNITDVTYPDDPVAKVNISNNANGTVNITVDGKSFVKPIENGYVQITLTDLAAGVKVATVKFISSDGYNDNITINQVFVINQADPEFTISVSDVTYDTNVTVTHETSANAGSVTYTIYDKDNHVVASGVKDISEVFTYKLAAGTYRVVAEFSNANYTDANVSATVNVNKANSVVEVTVPENIDYGANATVTVGINATATGDIVFYVDGVKYNETRNNFNITDLAAGKHSVMVVYDADNNFTSYSNNFTVNVAKVAPVISISDNATKYLENASFTISTDVPGYYTL
ncbi:MAG: Ig-like domain repeat protein, partial [Methanobrevibacter sp.]|nr:Ig-like domain repeat protein [Methanobrevibacter sp.]